MKKAFLLFPSVIIALLSYYGCTKSDSPASPGTSDPGTTPVATSTMTPALSFTDTQTPFSTSTATPGGAIVPDAYEDDDTPYQAKLITSGASQSRSAHACDEEDWIYFTLTSGADVNISTSGTSFPTYIQVFDDQAKTTYIFGAGDGSGPAAASQPGLAAGTYYAGIRAYNYASPGCDVFNYTLSFSVTYLPTGTQTETDTATETETYTETETATESCTETETYTLTSTPSVTSTSTHTFTETVTAGPTGDAYEPDNTSAAAKAITPGVTQNRNTCPAIDKDYASFSLPSLSAVNVTVTGTSATYTLSLLNSSLTGVCGGLSSSGTVSTGCVLGAGDYFILVESFDCEAYTLDLSVGAVTPTYTNTGTFTATGTGTPTVTITSTPQNTPTPCWQDYYSYGFTDSGYARMHSDGTNFSLSYIYSGSLYADTGTSVTSDSLPSYYGREMIYRLGSDTISIYPQNDAYIHVRSSSDAFASSLGGGTTGRGYYPCVAAAGNTVYAAFTDVTGGADMRTSVKYSYNNGAWQYFGGDGGVYNQSDTTVRRLSMELVATDPHDLYVAYIDQASAVYVKHNNGSGWVQVGSGPVFSSNVQSVDLSVVNASVMYCAVLLTDWTINVKKLSGGAWLDAGTNPVVAAAVTGNGDFSLAAISSTEAYLAYQNPQSATITAQAYNGTSWSFMGPSEGFSAYTGNNPNVFKQGGTVYCGFIDNGLLGLLNVMSYQ